MLTLAQPPSSDPAIPGQQSVFVLNPNARQRSGGDDGHRQAARGAHEMQNVDYNEGTYIIPIFVPSIDGHGTHVQGIHGSKTGQSLGNYDFKNMWIL
jgi:hypothetical protein